MELHEVFRKKAADSAQKVVEIVLPHTRIDLSKFHYEALLALLDVFSGEYHYAFAPPPLCFPLLCIIPLARVEKHPKASRKEPPKRTHSKGFMRTTSLTLLLTINHGIWTFRDLQSPALSSSSSLPAPLITSHEFEIERFRLVHVVQNVGYQMKLLGFVIYMSA